MSKIEWTNTTWNIITGCTKCSEGCKNCYAERMHKRLTGMGQEKYREPFSKAIFHSKELNRVLGKNKLVFVNSMSDTFHEGIQDCEIRYLLAACRMQPFNQFQILTKRAERLPDFKYPDNVWLGVTVENVKHKERIAYLKKTNAKIKFLSCEPLLEDLGKLDLNGIDWVIVGGESGPKARFIHPDWVRNIQQQCKQQNIPFFFKQWGEWSPYKPNNEKNIKTAIYKPTCMGISSLEQNLLFYKVGKTRAGSLLDGKRYKELPAWEPWKGDKNGRFY